MGETEIQESNANSLLNDIKSNWVLIVVLMSFVIGYTTLQNEVAQHTAQIENLQKEQLETQKSIISFGNDMTYIKTTLEYIKQSVSKNY